MHQQNLHDHLMAHDGRLVCLSFAVALVASYTALDMGTRLRMASGTAHRLWLFGSAVVLGTGIWSTHFIGMLAFKPGVAVDYDFGLTALSLLIAVAVTAIGFHLVTYRARSVRRLILAGCVVGCGITGMHYLGMHALILDATVQYDPVMVLASLLVAVAAATAAFWLTLNLTTRWLRAAAATMMAFAICGMHYVGMLGLSVTIIPGPMPDVNPVSPTILAATIATNLCLILCLAMACILFDQHLQLMSERKAEELARLQPLAANEARLRNITDIASDWIWETDAAYVLTFISKRFGDTSGIAWADVIGRAFGDLVGLGFNRSGMSELLGIMDARGSFQSSIQGVELPNGTTRFWRLSGGPYVSTTTGQFAGYRGSGTDVTATMEHEAKLTEAVMRAEAAERAARELQERLVDAIEAIPESFVLHDAEDRLVLCNSRYAELYQLSTEAVKPGARFEDALRITAQRADPTADPCDIDALVAERLARHRAADGNREDKHLANGRWVQILERRTSDGGTVGIGIDVTEERQRAAAESDREKLAALGHLAGGVAHEINNLLQPALGISDLLRDSLPPDDTEAHEALDHVLDSTRKMREIVRNILLFARKEDPRLAPVDLVTELRVAIGFVGNLVPPSIEVREQDLDAHRGAMVAVNKTQLTQVVTNLLVNAAQATTGSGTVTVSVARVCPDMTEAAELAIEPGRPYLAVSIADTGCGMDAATCARIFEPFFTTKPVGQGTGLGLSVAYGILRSWHGAITVRSEVGQGTTFMLYVPVIEDVQAERKTA